MRERSLGSSPWGAVQHLTNVLAGMVSVSTASHGGIIVAPDRLERMPAYMREAWAGRGAFEEDVDWSIPFCVFEAEILADGDIHSKKLIEVGHHRETLRNWHPARYEKFYRVVLKPGESRRKDGDDWKRVNAGALQSVSAFGDWQNGVPAGMVGVVACIGGRTDQGQYGGACRYFLVPKAEYDTRTENACGTFIVDQAKHGEVGDFTALGSKERAA